MHGAVEQADFKFRLQSLQGLRDSWLGEPECTRRRVLTAGVNDGAMRGNG